MHLVQETFIYSQAGFDIEYIKWGNSSVPTWFFIHGFGGNARTFSSVISHLVTRGESVVSVSLPFHGGSSDVESDTQFFDIEILGNVMADLAQSMGMKNYALVSHSLGSRVVLWIAVNRQNEVGSYHIMNPAGFYPWEIRFFSWFSDGFLARSLEIPYWAKTVTSFLIPNPEKRIINAFKWLSKSYPFMCLHQKKVFIQLFKIDKTMHIYWGDLDRLLPLAFAQEVKQHFSKGMVHVIENAGHLPMKEHPIKLAELLIKNRDHDQLASYPSLKNL